MSLGVISELNIYPVKSLQGISLVESEVLETGLKWDRHWMIVNDDGLFVSQRHFPEMARISTELTSSHLILNHPEHGSISVALQYSLSNKRQAKIWKSECQVLDEGVEIGQWLTSAIGKWRGQNLHLVRMAFDFNRAVSVKHTKGENSTLFADGYPFLITTTSSLAYLNSELVKKGFQSIPMSRFRANIVIDNYDAFVEHQNQYIEFTGNRYFHLCKPCQRCKVTGVDQMTGVEIEPSQPFKTLETLGQVNKKGAYFGQQCVIAEHSKSCFPASLKLGESVKFVKTLT